MQGKFARTAAAALLFATIAAPAFADDGRENREGRGNGRGWGSVMASFRAEKKELKAEIKEARQEHKAERKEDRRGRKPTESESNLCLKDAKANRETALSAARKSFNASVEAAKATNASSMNVAKNVRVAAYASAQATFLASDKSLSAHIALLTAKSKAMSDWRTSNAAAQTVMINAKAAAQKAFDAAKLKIEVDYKTAVDKCKTVATDTTAPSAVSTVALSDVTTSGMKVTWTSVGDDGVTGSATSSDLRYSTSPITDANFAAAVQVSGEPIPAVAGTSQSIVVSTLSANTTYYFAMKVTDEAGNVSSLSNVANAVTLAVAVDTTVPNTVTNLSISALTSTSATLSWTAPGDDAAVGTATSYDVRFSTSPITEANFASATQASGEPAPSVAGTSQSLIVSVLTANTTYHFALKSTDNAANISGMSNVPSVTTLP